MSEKLSIIYVLVIMVAGTFFLYGQYAGSNFAEELCKQNMSMNETFTSSYNSSYQFIACYGNNRVLYFDRQGDSWELEREIDMVSLRLKVGAKE